MAHYFRKVIHIPASMSPNVRFAQAQISKGLTPTDEELVPGVLTWSQYCQRRATWDPIRQAIGLDAMFYEGADALLYPPEWLNRAERFHQDLVQRRAPRIARAIGIDTGEGIADTAWAVVDDYGLIELISKKTPDTSVIIGETMALMRRYGVSANNICFDRGGGGKQHADLMRRRGYDVRTVFFGESVQADVKRYQVQYVPFANRLNQREERTVYKNRRAEMYWRLREMLDPEGDPIGSSKQTFALPIIPELRCELAPLPMRRDEEGRFYLPSKSKRDEKDTRQTLIDIVGHSPDKADALVVAIYAMSHKFVKAQAGVFR